MAFIPVVNTAQVDMVVLFAGQRCQNVFHYTKASPWAISHMEELAEGMIDWWVANIKPSVSVDLSLIQVDVTDMSEQNAPGISWGTGLPQAGITGTGTTLPNSISCVFTKRTALRGRSYRGRIYHMGLTEAQVTGNSVVTLTVSQLIGHYEAALSIPLTVAVDEANMVVVSKYTNNAPRATGVATLVTNITSDGIVDSQRRRLPGRGQ